MVNKSLDYIRLRYIMEVLSKEQIQAIFAEIDKDNDGLVSRQDVESTDYALTVFLNRPDVLNVPPLSFRPSPCSPTKR
jgi:hypothetical protein